MKLRDFANAEFFYAELEKLVMENRSADALRAVIVPGGLTPMPLYSRLSKSGGRSSAGLRLILSDERYCPADSPHSNQGAILPVLMSGGFSRGQFIVPDTKRSLESSSECFRDEIGDFLESGGTISSAILGVGGDGHTAGIFDKSFINSDSFVATVSRPDGLDGITCTGGLFELAQRLVFILRGKEKRAIVEMLMSKPLETVAGIIGSNHEQAELWFCSQ